MIESLEVGLDSWIIQDGNYGDFEVGKQYAFALEFGSQQVSLSDNQAKSITLIEDAFYHINAEIVFITQQVCVIDFGWRAYQENSLKEQLKPGDFITLNAYLGVDPFFYFESLRKIKGIPPLIYQWELKGIKMDKAPFVERQQMGMNMLVRDESRKGYESVQRTNAWKDDNGNASYLLTVQKMNAQPTYKL